MARNNKTPRVGWKSLVLAVIASTGIGASGLNAQNGEMVDLGFTVSEEIPVGGGDPTFVAMGMGTDSAFHDASGGVIDSNLVPAALPGESASPKGTGGNGNGYDSLNHYFDSYQGEDATSYVDGSEWFFNSPVRDGLFPAGNKMFGRLFFDGWISGSAFNNNLWPVTNGFDEKPNGKNSSGSSYQMNQVYATMGREIEWSDHLDVGGRIDVLYGSDYILASSLGLESFNHTPYGAAAENLFAAEPRWSRNKRGGYAQYGLAVPQAYMEAYAPLLSGLSVKMGHFYSPMGYESVATPNNFFYSHSYTMLYGQPQTLTGLLAKWRINPEFALVGGFSEGWNVFDDNNGEMDVMGGFTWERGGSSLSFLLMSGEAVIDNQFLRRNQEYEPINGRQTNYSLVYQQKLGPVLTYVLEHDLGLIEDGSFHYDRDFQKIREDGHWYSVVNYLYLSLAPTLDVGARAEWFCDQNHTRLLRGTPTSFEGCRTCDGFQWEGENLFDISLGLNWRPTGFITIRPEVRWDYSDIKMTNQDGTQDQVKGIFDDFKDDNMLTFGGDVIVHF